MGVRLGLVDGLLDLEQGIVARAGQRAHLTEQEHALLRFLAERGEAGATRDDIHRRVFGYLGATASRAADHAVKRLRKKLEVDPRAPRHLLTRKGGGYRLCTEGGSADQDLIGRGDAQRRALQALQEAHVLAITGMGGIGKTTLARAVWAAWQGPAHWVPLAGAVGIDQVVGAIAASTSVPLDARSAGDAALLLAEALGGSLVVLDEAEGCLEAVADLLAVWALAPDPPRVVLTSRVPPPRLDARELALGPLFEADALELLARWDPSGDGGAHHGLVRLLGGHPLALQIAVRAGPDAAHREVREVVAWAWRMLSEAERDVLTAASLFPRGASLHVLGQVAERPSAVPRALRRLIELSLLHRGGGGRSVLVAAPETVRAYVHEVVALDGHTRRFVRALEALALEARARLDTASWTDAYATLAAHHLDLREAVRHAAACGDPAGVRIALALEIADQQRSTREAQAALWDQVATLLPTGDEALDDRAALTLALNRRLSGGRAGRSANPLDVARRAAARGDVETETAAIERASFAADGAARAEILARCEALGRGAVDPASRARLHLAEAMILRQLGRLPQACERARIAADVVRAGAGRLRYVRLHAALLLVYVGEPAAAAVDLQAADAEPWLGGFRLSRSILRSARAWAVAQVDSAASLALFAEAALGLAALAESNEVVLRHRVWEALARLDAGAGADPPVDLAGALLGLNLCGAALLWCVRGERDRAIAALHRGLAPATSAHHRAWLEVSLALAAGDALPEVAIDDPVLSALTDAFSSDPRRRAAGARWGSRSLWLRAWHRAAAPR